MKKLIPLSLLLLTSYFIQAQWVTIPSHTKPTYVLDRIIFNPGVSMLCNSSTSNLHFFDSSLFDFRTEAVTFTPAYPQIFHSNYLFNNGRFNSFKHNLKTGTSTRISFLDDNGDSIFRYNEFFHTYFYDTLNGWAITGDSTDECKKIYTTENGGFSWQKVACENIQILNNKIMSHAPLQNLIQFDTVVYLLHPGDNNVMIKVLDKGKKWQQINLPFSYPTNSDKNICFKDPMNGLKSVLESTGWALYKTEDGGATWAKQNIPVQLKMIDYAKPTATKEGFYFASGAVIPVGGYISYDDGESWLQIDEYNHTYFAFRDAEFGFSNELNFEKGDEVRVFIGMPTIGVQNNFTSTTISVYPNPTINTITFDAKEKGELMITDLKGKLILNQTIESAGNISVDLNKHPQGVYFIRIVGTNNIYHAKFIKH
jgi:hypothetical protein